MKRFSDYALIAIVVVSIALQMLAAARMSFWEDEVFTANFAARGSEVVAKVVETDVHPPLYLYLASYWGKVFGYDEFGLRFLSILFSVLALFLTYLLALNLMGRGVALASTALLAFSPLFIMFGHQARYYSMTVFLAAAVVYAMWRYLNTRKWLFLVLYILLSIAICYVLFAAMVVIVVCAGWGVFDRWQRFCQSKDRIWILEGSFWILAQFLILTAYLPGLTIFKSLLSRSTEIAGVGNWPVELFKRLVYSVYVFTLGETISPLNPLAWVGLTTLFVTAIYAIYRNSKRAAFWLPLTLVSAIMLSGLLGSIQASVSMTWQNLPVRAFYVLPFLSIWICSGLAALKPRWMRLAALCLILVYVVGIYNFFAGREYLRPIFSVPWRTMFGEIRQTAAPGTLVICGEGDSSCTYYSRSFGFNGHNYQNWPALSSSDYPEVWWVQNNLSRSTASRDEEIKILNDLSARFSANTIIGYGQQDAGIRWLKNKWMSQDDYEFRTVVYRFYNP